MKYSWDIFFGEEYIEKKAVSVRISMANLVVVYIKNLREFGRNRRIKIEAGKDYFIYFQNNLNTIASSYL